MYIQRNIEARSRNHCCRVKQEVFRVCVCVRVPLRVGVCMSVRECSLGNTARKAHAPCCHLWPLWLHHIFRHYVINGTIFGKKFSEHEMCFHFFYSSFV